MFGGGPLVWFDGGTSLNLFGALAVGGGGGQGLGAPVGGRRGVILQPLVPEQPDI